jgi:hypothetical protein
MREIVDHFTSTVQDPSLAQDLLAHVIHPESAACLGNHIIRFCQFSCQRGETWVASITLRSWRVDSNGPQSNDDQSQAFKDDEPIYLPQKFKQVWGNASQKKKKKLGLEKLSLEKLSFELDVSSIVISTNAFGDFSKCTVVSKLVGNDDMMGIVQSARKLWQKFIHQPQTARCLVFFLVLGKICQHITQNYKEAVELLTSILELNVSQRLTNFEIAECLNSPVTEQFRSHGTAVV